MNYANAHWSGAGFPHESSGHQYIMEFVYYDVPRRGDAGRELTPAPRGRGEHRGYRYVDVEEADGRYRYSLRDPSTQVPGPDPAQAYGTRTLTAERGSPYVISYEDIADPEGRANWIAGGHVKVTDARSGQVLGEFIRYAFEPGFGSTAGGRSPWAFARECPTPAYEGAGGHIRYFVEQVLKPTQEQ